MKRTELIADGISPERADYLIECERHCKAKKAYEEAHPDALEAYEYILADLYNVHMTDIQDIYFDVWINLEPNEPHVFLGQDEIEIQLPEPLTPEEADYFGRHTDFVVNDSNPDLAYALYDDRLVVRAKLYQKET